VRDELALLWASTPTALRLAPAIGLVDCGTASSGKTTTTGKTGKGSPRMATGRRGFDRRVSSARANSLPKWRRLSRSVLPGTGTDKPLEIFSRRDTRSKTFAYDVILVDTADAHIDDTLMEELGTLKRELAPVEILLLPTP